MIIIPTKRFQDNKITSIRIGWKKGLVGTSTAILGSAIIGGAAAVGSAAIAKKGAKKAASLQSDAVQRRIEADKLAATEAKQEREQAAAVAKQERGEAIQRKEQAVKDIKFPTFLESEPAQKLKTTLEDRISGRGVGLDIDIDKTTAPFAEQRREGFQKKEVPAIAAAASSRGLGRSTIPVSQIGAAAQDAERDIEQRIAQLQLQKAQAKRQDVGTAVGRYQDLTGAETGSRERKAIFERGGEFDIANTMAGHAELQRSITTSNAEIEKRDQFSIAQAMQQKGEVEAANELREAAIVGSGLLGLGLNLQQSMERADREIIDTIEKTERDRRNAALVNIATV